MKRCTYPKPCGEKRCCMTEGTDDSSSWIVGLLLLYILILFLIPFTVSK